MIVVTQILSTGEAFSLGLGKKIRKVIFRNTGDVELYTGPNELAVDRVRLGARAPTMELILEEKEVFRG